MVQVPRYPVQKKNKKRKVKKEGLPGTAALVPNRSGVFFHGLTTPPLCLCVPTLRLLGGPAERQQILHRIVHAHCRAAAEPLELSRQPRGSQHRRRFPVRSSKIDRKPVLAKHFDGMLQHVRGRHVDPPHRTQVEHAPDPPSALLAQAPLLELDHEASRQRPTVGEKQGRLKAQHEHLADGYDAATAAITPVVVVIATTAAAAAAASACCVAALVGRVLCAPKIAPEPRNRRLVGIIDKDEDAKPDRSEHAVGYTQHQRHAQSDEHCGAVPRRHLIVPNHGRHVDELGDGKNDHDGQRQLGQVLQQAAKSEHENKRGEPRDKPGELRARPAVVV